MAAPGAEVSRKAALSNGNGAGASKEHAEAEGELAQLHKAGAISTAQFNHERQSLTVLVSEWQ